MQMKTWLLIMMSLLVMKNFTNSLRIRPTIHQLLFDTSEAAIKETFRGLFTQPLGNLNLFIELALCDYFDFAPFMPKDLALVEPVLRILRQNKCPSEIQERLYDFYELQNSSNGRKFLLENDANFAKVEWNPYLFEGEDVMKILLKIQTSCLSQVEYLPSGALSRVLEQGDADEVNFFGVDGRWNLFGIVNFAHRLPSLSVCQAWLKQIKPQVQVDDLLFYRLSFLSWHYQRNEPAFSKSIRKILESMPLKGFKSLVFDYYFQKKEQSLLEIPNWVLGDNLMDRATLHFENLFAALKMGHKVPVKKIEKLFQTFDPTVVSAFLCRSVIERFDYFTFTSSVLRSSPKWTELWLRTRRELLYFPKKFLPVNAQVRLWRHQWLRVSDSPSLDGTKLFLNHSQSWTRYLQKKQKDEIATERDGFTFVDCEASKESIVEFVEGKIVGFALFDYENLPKFPLICKRYGLVDERRLKNAMKKMPSNDGFCIIKESKNWNSMISHIIDRLKTNHHTINGLDEIIKVYKKWGIPELLFASF